MALEKWIGGFPKGARMIDPYERIVQYALEQDLEYQKIQLELKALGEKYIAEESRMESLFSAYRRHRILEKQRKVSYKLDERVKQISNKVRLQASMVVESKEVMNL